MKREVTCNRGIMGRSMQNHLCESRGLGVNVITNLLMSPEACSPPWQTLLWQWDTYVTVTPRGIWRGGGGGGSNMLTVWTTGPLKCSVTEMSKKKWEQADWILMKKQTDKYIRRVSLRNLQIPAEKSCLITESLHQKCTRLYLMWTHCYH